MFDQTAMRRRDTCSPEQESRLSLIGGGAFCCCGSLLEQGGKRNEPDVGIAVVPALHALKVFLRLLMRARKVNREDAIAAEIERPVIWAEMRFVIGAESVRFLLIAKITNLLDLPPSVSLPAHEEEMIFCVPV